MTRSMVEHYQALLAQKRVTIAELERALRAAKMDLAEWERRES